MDVYRFLWVDCACPEGLQLADFSLSRRAAADPLRIISVINIVVCPNGSLQCYSPKVFVMMIVRSDL